MDSNNFNDRTSGQRSAGSSARQSQSTSPFVHKYKLVFLGDQSGTHLFSLLMP